MFCGGRTEACWAPTEPTTASPVRSAMATTIDLSTMSAILLRGRSAGGRVLLETHVLDLVEERAVADPQHLGGLHAVPATLLERVSDDVALGLQHRAPR